MTYKNSVFDCFGATTFLKKCFVSHPAELNQIIDSKDIELNSLKNSLRLLDREKDALQMEVDRKTEQVAALQQELSSKV